MIPDHLEQPLFTIIIESSLTAMDRQLRSGGVEWG